MSDAQRTDETDQQWLSRLSRKRRSNVDEDFIEDIVSNADYLGFQSIKPYDLDFFLDWKAVVAKLILLRDEAILAGNVQAELDIGTKLVTLLKPIVTKS